MIKFYYNINTFQLIGIDDNEESIIKGDNGTKELGFFFGVGTDLESFVLDTTVTGEYGGRLNYERPDGETTNNLYLTPYENYYKITVIDWMTQVEGTSLLTARLRKVVSEEITYTNFGVASLPIEAGASEGDQTITEAQYEAIQDAVDGAVETGTSNEARITIVEETQEDIILGTQALDKVNWNIDAVNENDLEIGESAYIDGILKTRLSDSVVLSHGEEQLRVRRNNTGAILNDFVPVYVTGAVGQKVTVALAGTGVTDILSKQIEVMTQDLDNNSNGYSNKSGEVKRTNTTGSQFGESWNDGDIIYLGSTAGTMTNVEPTAPTPKIRLGHVVYAHLTNGVFEVDVRYISNLGDLSNVDLTGAVENDTVKRNALGVYVTDNRVTSLVNSNLIKEWYYAPSTGIVTLTYYDDTTTTIDLPLELIIESGYYNEDDNKLVLVLANGNEIDIPVGDLLTDLDAVNIRYANGDSSLIAVNVKAAIDELDEKIVNLDSGDIAVGTTESPSGTATTQLGVNKDVTENVLEHETRLQTINSFEFLDIEATDYFIEANGNLVSSSTRKLYKVDVEEGQKIKINVYNSVQPDYVIKNSSGDVTRYSSGGTEGYYEYDLTIKYDEEELYVNTVPVFNGDIQTTIKKYILDDVEKIFNKYDYDYNLGYVSTSGTINTSTTRAYVEIDVNINEKYKITTTANVQPLYILLDDDNNVLLRRQYNDTTVRTIEEEITIPKDGKLYINCNIVDDVFPISIEKEETYNLEKTKKQYNFVTYGDSMLNYLCDSSYGDLVNKMKEHGVSLTNYAVGGETSQLITARQGSNPMYVQPFTIPATTTSTVIDITDIDGNALTPLLQGDATSINPCYISGIKGDISRVSSVYYFTREEAGDETVISYPTPVITNAWINNRYDYVIIWFGTNDGYTETNYDVSQTLGRARGIIESMKTLNKEYIILNINPLAVTTEETNEVIDQQFINEFGYRVVNYRTFLINYGLDILGLTPTSDDLVDISIGRIPRQLRLSVGTHHLTADANKILVDYVIERMKYFDMI